MLNALSLPVKNTNYRPHDEKKRSSETLTISAEFKKINSHVL